MVRYRRLYIKGGQYFFTVVTHNRKRILTHANAIQHLRKAFLKCKERYPFDIDAVVILPDHLHCIWTLPDEDDDFSKRWSLLKRYFSTALYKKDNEPIWQNRYWEHLIRDDKDYERHMDYIHYNPVKHGLAKSPMDWPYGSFRRDVRDGLYHPRWGASEEPGRVVGLDFE